MRPLHFVFAVTALLASCTSDSSQQEVSINAALSSDLASPTFENRGWSITLSEAKIALGPIYFCATQAASFDFCEESVLESRNAVVLDLLSNSSATLPLVGLSGTARSAMFDYGISFLLPAQTAGIARGNTLGHSARLVGLATKGAQSVRFEASLDVLPKMAGSFGVAGYRFGDRAIGPETTMRIVFSPQAWFANVNFDELAGTEDQSSVVFARGTPAYEAVLQSLAANALPQIFVQ